MTTNQTNLIHRAISSPRRQATAGNWSAHRDDYSPYVSVFHYRTLMFRIHLPTQEVIPISRGWASVSDKQGVGKILRGFGLNLSYKDVYEEANA